MLNDRRPLSGWPDGLKPLPVLVALLAACAVQEASSGARDLAATPPVLFTVDLWPGEGIPVIEARRSALPLRAAPDPGSRVVDTLRGRVGQRLVYDSTRLQTIEAGSMRVLNPMQVAGRDMGEVTHVSLDEYYAPTRRDVSVPVPASSTIDFLQHRAEGTCFVRVDRKVIDANPCPAFTTDHVRVEREPLTRWWIRVRGQGGVSGWVLVSDSTAQSTRREF